MNDTFELENKPKFVNGQLVRVDLFKLTGTLKEEKVGKVIGKSFSNIYDLWILDFIKPFSDTYPFQAVCVPHFCILKEKIHINYEKPASDVILGETNNYYSHKCEICKRLYSASLREFIRVGSIFYCGTCYRKEVIGIE